MSQHRDSEWQMLHPIPDEAAASARLVIAGAAHGTDDALLLMQACGLVDDPLAGNIMITRNGTRKKRAAYNQQS